MSLPPRAFYSLNETSARWGCAAADLAGWAATDHLTLVTSIASVICGKQPVAGIVVFSDGGQNAGVLPQAAVEMARQARLPLPVHRSSTSRVCPDSHGSMLPSASSSAMKLRGTMARSST